MLYTLIHDWMACVQQYIIIFLGNLTHVNILLVWIVWNFLVEVTF